MKEDMKKVFLPRGRKNEENFVLVSVNGRSYKIMKGVEVEVPECVAEVLDGASKAISLGAYAFALTELDK